MAARDLSVRVGALTLANPVLTASGTFGYGLEFQPFFDIARLGGICTKGLSLHPRDGNAPPRIAETASGMLNAIGLANVGVDAFIADKLPGLRAVGATVVANIFASAIPEFVELAARLDPVPGVAALELNISCPNVHQGGLEFGKDPRAAAEVTRAVRGASRLPLWVKLSPEAGDPAAVARACVDAGADAVTVMNTIRGMAIDHRTRRVVLANRTGGLSGPAIKPLALRLVYEVARAVSVPVIGIGGISTWQDAAEFLLAGATAIQVGTASFINPRAAIEVVEGLAAYCEAEGCDAKDLVGALRD
jgi:dihydroorotate dehydrogenase (NAD+) catalytic subunit